MEAIWTGPCGLVRLDHLATNQTLQFPGIDFPDQFFALRTIGEIEFNVGRFCVTIGFKFVKLLSMVVTGSLLLLGAATVLWSIIGVFVSIAEMVVALMVILITIVVIIGTTILVMAITAPTIVI